MTITHVKIHPAIGVARVGNSPSEWFWGPEYPGERPAPPFKDESCRIKKQAARFRLFAYHDDGPPTPLTAADGEITWTIRVANRKTAPRILDSGEHTLRTPTQGRLLEATVVLPGSSPPAFGLKLGSAHVQENGHLRVLAGDGVAGRHDGAGTPPMGWYDDVGDGPVNAEITLKTGETFSALNGAWIVMAPPRFAPNIDSVITLYDHLFNAAHQRGWLPAGAVVDVPSYTQHIQPILQRARDVRWLRDVDAHGWTEPVYAECLRVAIFARLRNPDGPSLPAEDMPALGGSPSLTSVQYGYMRKWAEGSFVEDWTGAPVLDTSITPAGLDRAAIEACVGGAFAPGIEVGGSLLQPPPPYLFVGSDDPLRINPAMQPGSLTAGLNLPWHTDLANCGGWWPVAAPSSVFPEGSDTRVSWRRDLGDPVDFALHTWPLAGFIEREPGTERQVERERCGIVEVPDSDRWAEYVDILFGVVQDGGGWILVNGKPRPVGPWDPLRHLGPHGRDALRALAMAELAGDIEDAKHSRRMRDRALKLVLQAVNALIDAPATRR